MNERPTPIVDSSEFTVPIAGKVIASKTARGLERERDEAREALREIWQSGDAFLPHVDQETINRWRKAAGWEETK